MALVYLLARILSGMYYSTAHFQFAIHLFVTSLIGKLFHNGACVFCKQ
jgi:hypothetical protein